METLGIRDTGNFRYPGYWKLQVSRILETLDIQDILETLGIQDTGNYRYPGYTGNFRYPGNTGNFRYPGYWEI